MNEEVAGVFVATFLPKIVEGFKKALPKDFQVQTIPASEQSTPLVLISAQIGQNPKHPFGICFTVGWLDSEVESLVDTPGNKMDRFLRTVPGRLGNIENNAGIDFATRSQRSATAIAIHGFDFDDE